MAFLGTAQLVCAPWVAMEVAVLQGRVQGLLWPCICVPAVPQQPLALAFQGLLFILTSAASLDRPVPGCGNVAAPSPLPCSRRQLWLLLMVLLLCRETPESSWAQPNETISLKQRTLQC